MLWVHRGWLCNLAFRGQRGPGQENEDGVLKRWARVSQVKEEGTGVQVGWEACAEGQMEPLARGREHQSWSCSSGLLVITERLFPCMLNAPSCIFVLQVKAHVVYLRCLFSKACTLVSRAWFFSFPHWITILPLPAILAALKEMKIFGEALLRSHL